MSAKLRTRPSSKKRWTVFSPRPSMSIAPRAAKWPRACWICAGQDRLGQRICTSPGGCTTGVPHAGQRSGMTKARSAPVRSCVSGPTTCGITSPARWTMTLSPIRRPLRATSSWLWRVESRTVAPPTETGSRTANGTRAPVRPTLTMMSRRVVTAVVGGNL